MKNFLFPIIILFIILVNSFIFLPKYGSWNGATDIEYEIIAKNLIRGGGFSINGEKTMFREPGYPFFVFGIYKIFGERSTVVRVFQFAILFAIIFIIYKISLKLFGRRTAQVSSIVVAIFPIFSIYATDLISETLAVFFMLLFLLFFIKSFSEEKNKYIFAGSSGLFLGLLALTKSIFIFLPLALVLVYFFISGENKLKKAVIFYSFFLLIISPWMARNYLNFGKFAIADRGGMILYLHALKSEFNYEQLKNYAVSSFLGEYFVRSKNHNYDIVYGEGIDIMNKERSALLERGYSSSEADDTMYKKGKELLYKHPIKNFFIGIMELSKLNAPMTPKYSVMFSFHDNINNSFLEKFLMKGFIVLSRLLWNLGLAVVFFGCFVAMKEKKFLVLPMIVSIVYLNGMIFFLQGVPRFAFLIYPFYFILFSYGSLFLFNKFLKTKI